MKKVIIVCVIATLIFGVICLSYRNYQKSIEGMEVTMLGGSNVKENGNTNSMGYIIRTKNGEIIVVDGGTSNDADEIKEYIMKYGNGVVNYWYITHAHSDHVGALVNILEDKENSITIENICYYFNSLEWYEQYDKRGYETEKAMISHLDNDKILNKIECKKSQIIKMDNVDCEILRIANPEVTNSDNGNDSSMCFKMTATDVNKSVLFLGDAFYYANKELLESGINLKADAVQMAHHGQNGVSKELYEAVEPDICFFNTPEWLYNNDNGNGYNSGKWKTITVRSWIKELGAESFVAYNGDVTIKFTSDGYYVIENKNKGI